MIQHVFERRVSQLYLVDIVRKKMEFIDFPDIRWYQKTHRQLQNKRIKVRKLVFKTSLLFRVYILGSDGKKSD